jgi:hypothetical protein
MQAGAGTDRTLVSSIMCARCPVLCACCPSHPARCSGKAIPLRHGIAQRHGIPLRHGIPRRHGIAQRHKFPLRHGIPRRHVCIPYGTVSHCGTVHGPAAAWYPIRHGISLRHGIPHLHGIHGIPLRLGIPWQHGSMVSLRMGSIVVDTSEAELPTEAAPATDVAGDVPCEPTDAQCSCSSCNNDRMRMRTGSTQTTSR